MLADQKSEEPDYFAVIKLSNNEDIIGGVVVSEDETGLDIHDPLLVKQVTVMSAGILTQKYMLTPWVVHSSDNIFFIDGSHIVTHGEMSPAMFEEYTNYISSEQYIDFFYATEEDNLDTTDESLENTKNKLQKLYDESF